MPIVVVTPPPALVSPDEAKVWAPAFAADDDARITALLAAAQAAIEPPSWLNAALGAQTLRYEAACRPPSRGLRLPYGPVNEVLSVVYGPLGDDEQTVDASTYALVGARLVLADGHFWPAGQAAPTSVRITYQAGFPADDPRLDSAKQAIVLGALKLRSLSTQDLHLRSVEVPGIDTRTWTVSDAASKLIQGGIEDLLSGYRVYAI